MSGKNDDEVKNEIDVLAVQRDNELLDALGARHPVPSFAADDVVAGLLSAFVDEVDEGLGPPATAFSSPPPSGIRLVHKRRRVGPRTIVGLGVAGALFSASGVAAAVTGNPLGPLPKAIGKVTGEKKPDQKATPEQVDRQLAEVEDAIDSGNREEARKRLQDLKQKAKLLPADQAKEALEQAEDLEAKLAGETPLPAPSAVPTAVPTPGGTSTANPPLTEEEKRELAKQQRREQRKREREERKRRQDEENKQQGRSGTAEPAPGVSPASIPASAPAPDSVPTGG